PGELKSGGFLRESILADALEAILGAAFLDGGLDAVRAIVASLMRQRLDDLPDGESVKDSKTRLQELLQARGMALPDYRVVDESGADHQRRFTVRCTVPLLDCPLDATATSRRKAEQAAARAVLDRIEAQS
ncbi:MAG: putative dsRNA-binding protein, partial [Wenzhouxiangellaceae bacterium]|nr:putative dsRNA-binding protein [Wenzhouxiangellaceae bacterium]